MKRLETIEVIVTYCDYCGGKLHPPYAIIKLKNGKEVDLCDDKGSGQRTCLEKFKDELINNPQKSER